MITYKEFQPTSFDCKGLGLPDRQDWLVAPVGQNRDSEALYRSNFIVVYEDLIKYGYDDVEIHRFGHWGPGWFEIILVRPNTEAAKIAEEWECALSDYPVADEMHLSQLESEEENEEF